MTRIELISESQYKAKQKSLQEYKSLSRSNLKLDFAARQLSPTDILIRFVKSEGKLYFFDPAVFFNWLKVSN